PSSWRSRIWPSPSPSPTTSASSTSDRSASSAASTNSPPTNPFERNISPSSRRLKKVQMRGGNEADAPFSAACGLRLRPGKYEALLRCVLGPDHLGLLAEDLEHGRARVGIVARRVADSRPPRGGHDPRT